MFRDGKLLCDSCQAEISRVNDPPADGWPHLHNLCSSCFAALHQKG